MEDSELSLKHLLNPAPYTGMLFLKFFLLHIFLNCQAPNSLRPPWPSFILSVHFSSNSRLFFLKSKQYFFHNCHERNKKSERSYFHDILAVGWLATAHLSFHIWTTTRPPPIGRKGLDGISAHSNQPLKPIKSEADFGFQRGHPHSTSHMSTAYHCFHCQLLENTCNRRKSE